MCPVVQRMHAPRRTREPRRPVKTQTTKGGSAYNGSFLGWRPADGRDWRVLHVNGRCTSGTYRSVRVCCRTRCQGSTALRPLAISSSSHGNSRAVAFLEITDVDGDGQKHFTGSSPDGGLSNPARWPSRKTALRTLKTLPCDVAHLETHRNHKYVERDPP